MLIRVLVYVGAFQFPCIHNYKEVEPRVCPGGAVAVEDSWREITELSRERSHGSLPRSITFDLNVQLSLRGSLGVQCSEEALL